MWVHLPPTCVCHVFFFFQSLSICLRFSLHRHVFYVVSFSVSFVPSLLNDSFDSLSHPLFLIDIHPLDARLPPWRRITLSLPHGAPLPRATAPLGSSDDRAQGSNSHICQGEQHLLMLASQRGGPGSGSSDGSSRCHYLITINSSLLSSLRLIAVILELRRIQGICITNLR